MKWKQALGLLALLVAACARDRMDRVVEPSVAVRPEMVEGVVAGFTGDELLVDEGPPDGRLVELGIDATTQWVGPGGESIDRGAIEEGDQVRVFYGPLSGNLQMASRVEVTARPALPDVVPEPLP